MVDFGGPEWKKRTTKVIDDVSFDKVFRSTTSLDFPSFKTATLDSIRALRLIRAYRINGHLIADLDPLKLHKKIYHPELDYKSYGFNKIGLTLPLNIIKKNQKKNLSIILKTASGFGGSNVAILIKKCKN